MRARVFVECDNPACKSAGPAEFPDTWLGVGELRKVKQVSPPYGWLVAKVLVFGPGPEVEVTVCRAACIAPAMDAALKELDR